MSKIYVVAKGIKPGFYYTWTECEKQVKGFSGAKYKSFSNKNDATNYWNEFNNISINDRIIIEQKCPLLKNVAYVDGSFKKDTMEYGCGGVIFDQQGSKFSFSFKGSDKDYTELWNIGGEILSAKFVIEKCIEFGMKEVKIFHDYEGISKWYTGQWSANKVGTRKFKEFSNSVKDKINVSFEWVKGHSGNQYNEEADLLAGNALK